MAHIHADRVADTTTSTGTGAVTVSGSAPTGYRTFSAVMTTNDTCYYAIASSGSSEWEVGLGTYSAANQLTRTTILASSNSNNAVNFSAGTKDIFLTNPAARDNGTLYAATTDNAIARFDSTNGQLQNSGASINDNGFMSISGGLYENNTTISASYTITSSRNAMSAGPITINTGVAVTVPTGSRWVVL